MTFSRILDSVLGFVLGSVLGSVVHLKGRISNERSDVHSQNLFVPALVPSLVPAFDPAFTTGLIGITKRCYLRSIDEFVRPGGQVGRSAGLATHVHNQTQTKNHRINHIRIIRKL
jgi:hypothetical protein